MNVLAVIAAAAAYSLLVYNGGAAASDSRRKRFPPTQNEVFDYVDKLMAIEDFRDSIVYNGESVRVRPAKAVKALLQVYDHLDRLDSLTTAFAFNFVRNKLLRHCDAAVELLKKKSPDPEAFAEAFGNGFKFPCDSDDFCVFAFLSHSRSKLPVDNMFGLVTFLQSFSQGPGQLDRNSLVAEIQNYRNTLNVHVDDKDNKSLVRTNVKASEKGPSGGRGCQSVPRSFESLSTSRGEFKSLSKALCSPSAIPIVDEEVFSARDVAPYDDGFIDYVMRKEKCEVHFQPITSWHHSPQKIIVKWNCYEILATRELRKGRYVPRQNHDLIVRFTTYKPNVEALLTLPELRKQLRLYNVGADILFYNKIEANAISVAVAKEGYKMLKAIAFTLEQMCKNQVTLGTFDEARARMMTKLFALNSVYQKFHDRISERLLIDVDGYAPKLFKLVTDYFLEKFSVRKDDGQQTMDKICQLSVTGFFNVNTNEYGDGEQETLAFHEYHFETPVVNIRRLYDFLSHHVEQSHDK